MQSHDVWSYQQLCVADLAIWPGWWGRLCQHDHLAWTKWKNRLQTEEWSKFSIKLVTSLMYFSAAYLRKSVIFWYYGWPNLTMPCIGRQIKPIFVGMWGFIISHLNRTHSTVFLKVQIFLVLLAQKSPFFCKWCSFSMLILKYWYLVHLYPQQKISLVYQSIFLTMTEFSTSSPSPPA